MLDVQSPIDVLERLGRALSDPTRSRILLALLEAPAHPAELATTLGATRQNISNHLACLRGCGIVTAEPEGRQVRYEIADPHLVQALRNLVSVVLAVAEDGRCHNPTCWVPECREACG